MWKIWIVGWFPLAIHFVNIKVSDLPLCHLLLALLNPKTPKQFSPEAAAHSCSHHVHYNTKSSYTHRGETKSYSQLPAVQLAPWAPSLPHITFKTCTAEIQTHEAIRLGFLCIRLRQTSIQVVAFFKDTHNASPLQSNSIHTGKKVKNKQRSSTLTTYKNSSSINTFLGNMSSTQP
jgi:hypothetical protein